jgi:hypothetical protein
MQVLSLVFVTSLSLGKSCLKLSEGCLHELDTRIEFLSFRNLDYLIKSLSNELKFLLLLLKYMRSSITHFNY